MKNPRHNKILTTTGRLSIRRSSKTLAICTLFVLLWIFLICRNVDISNHLPRLSRDAELKVQVDPWQTVPDPPPPPFTLESKGPPNRPHGNALKDAHGLVHAFNNPSWMPSPSCASLPELQARYPALIPPRHHTKATPFSNGTIYLALNLIKAESIMPNFIHEVATMVSLMGGHRFYFSVWENGSNDHTPGFLLLLEKALQTLGVQYKMVVKGTSQPPNKEDGRRIIELANVRNAALEELYDGSAAQKMGIDNFDMVLFMNDIIWCAADMLEIIEEHLTQSASMTCATDWGTRVVYDRWVARTMSGQPFYTQSHLLDYFNDRPWEAHGPAPPYPLPLLDDPPARKQFIAGGPFQVFSCWNGAAVIDPRAFFPQAQSSGAVAEAGADRVQDGIRFRTALNDKEKGVVTEKASECYLICVDLWKRGMGRIMMVPKASVAYELHPYSEIRQDGRRTIPHIIGMELAPNSSSSSSSHTPSAKFKDGIKTERIKVHWKDEPPKEVAYHDYAQWYAPERWGPWDEA